MTYAATLADVRAAAERIAGVGTLHPGDDSARPLDRPGRADHCFSSVNSGKKRVRSSSAAPAMPCKS